MKGVLSFATNLNNSARAKEMFLTKLKVENFLSVKGKCELPIDPRVTVLLGANDHGKSNLLRALQNLNFDSPIRAEQKNWDSESTRLDFIFKITSEEKSHLTNIRAAFKEECQTVLQKEEEESAVSSVEDGVEAEEGEGEQDAPRPIGKSNVQTSKMTATLPGYGTANRRSATAVIANEEEEEEEDEKGEEDEIRHRKPAAEMIDELNILDKILDSSTLTLTRDGVEADLTISGRPLNELSGTIYEALTKLIPRVELFEAFSGELQDSVTATEIREQEAEFLQGIFFYAGLDPLNCAELFHQDDETDKTLELASVKLDRELRKLWNQGVDLDLHFQLKHRGKSIELLAKDPAVKKRHARMSKRSAGVTQFFRLSMVLHARRKKNPANSYVYLFDEPGVFLHPKGQRDLLAVFEQLAEDTQIVYATHSLFMLNQNYPERHRLITKDRDTSLVDSKPYRANWRLAVDALGAGLNSSVLFSSNILLVEGDSDPIYIYELIRILNHLSIVDADANLLGIMSYSDLPNLRFLLQTFKAQNIRAGNKERLLCVLFDGDSQGKEYQKAVSSLCRSLDVKGISLDSGLAIEDYCLHPDIFLRAVEETLKYSYEAISKAVPADLSAQIAKSWESFSNQKVNSSQPRQKRAEEPAAIPSAAVNPEENAGSWFKHLSRDLTGEPSGGSSKVALARNYAFLSRENENIKDGLDPKKVQQAKILIDQIINVLAIPNMRAKKVIEA